VITAKGFRIRIRGFETHDLKRVMEIEDESFLNGDAGLYLELCGGWPEGFLVAENAGTMIGFVVLVLTLDGDGRIFSLAVDRRYRAKGVGRALLNAAFKTLRKEKIAYLWLEVRASNLVAQRLYRSMAFIEVDFIPFYYKDGEGAIRMWKVM